MRLRHAAGALVLAGLVMLTGCGGGEPEAEPTTSAPTETPTPTPTPEPTRPALSDLKVTTEGLGTLRIGGTLPDTDDPDTAMVAWDSDHCVDEGLGITESDPRAGGYATDPSYVPDAGLAPFYIAFSGDVLTRIDIRSPEIPTDGGVRIGDPTSAMLAAHPDAVDVLDRDGFTEVYQVTGTAGILLIEVTTDSGTGYWAPEQIDKVFSLIVVPAGSQPFGIAGSDNAVFGCAYGI
jgi:hypothetical protein